MSHLDEGTLHAWLDRDRSGLSAAERSAIESHLDACAVCASHLESARSVRERATLILAKAPPVVPPDFSEIRRRAEGRTGSTRRSPWLASAWAASLAVALGLGWVGRDLIPGGFGSGGSGSAPGPSPQPVEVAADIEIPPPPATAQESAPTQLPPPPVAASAAREAAPAAPASIPSSGDLVVRGRVTQPDGEPLASVQVSVAGTGAGTVTGPDGTYSVTLRPEALASLQEGLTLEVRRLGFQVLRTELTPGATDTIGADFQLAPTVLALQEIVATGRVNPVEGARSPISVGGVRPPDALDLWRPAERAEAETALGLPLVAVPDLPILAYEVGNREDGSLVRVLQELEDGILTLTLRRLPPADSTRSSDEPAAAAVRTIGELEVSASGSLSAEALQALLDRVR